MKFKKNKIKLFNLYAFYTCKTEYIHLHDDSGRR